MSFWGMRRRAMINAAMAAESQGPGSAPYSHYVEIMYDANDSSTWSGNFNPLEYGLGMGQTIRVIAIGSGELFGSHNGKGGNGGSSGYGGGGGGGNGGNGWGGGWGGDGGHAGAKNSNGLRGSNGSKAGEAVVVDYLLDDEGLIPYWMGRQQALGNQEPVATSFGKGGFIARARSVCVDALNDNSGGAGGTGSTSTGGGGGGGGTGAEGWVIDYQNCTVSRAPSYTVNAGTAGSSGSFPGSGRGGTGAPNNAGGSAGNAGKNGTPGDKNGASIIVVFYN